MRHNIFGGLFCFRMLFSILMQSSDVKHFNLEVQGVFFFAMLPKNLSHSFAADFTFSVVLIVEAKEGNVQFVS